MTRNTKFYKMSAVIDNTKVDIYYKDLSVTQLSVVKNIKNPVVQKEFAANLSVYNIDPVTIPFATKIQIGEDILFRCEQTVTDSDILDITIKEFRQNIQERDLVLPWISHLTRFFPGTSVIDLLNLTYKDLIELVVLAEEMSGSSIFGSNKKKGMSLVNPNKLEDGGKALRDQIRNLNASMGIK